MESNPQLVSVVRGLLNKLAAARKLSNDDREIVADEVHAAAKTLSSGDFLDALDKVTNKSEALRRESVYLLAEFTHVPEVVERIAKGLHNPDAEWRHHLTQIVGLKRLEAVAPYLNSIIESDPDIECRQSAIHAAGAIKSACNLPALLRLAESSAKELEWQITVALMEYADSAARPFFQKLFNDSTTEKSLRIMAAWGLAKLGDKKSVQYLAEMLFDPDIKTNTSYSPANPCGRRKLFCSLNGWHFEWNKSFVLNHRDEWRKSLVEC